MSKDVKGMLAAIFAYVIFGCSFLFSKMALNIAEPSLLLFARFGITFLVLNLMLLFRMGRLNLQGKNVMGAVVLGLLQPVLYFVFENYGIMKTTTSFSGMLGASSPILAVIFGAIFLKEMPGKAQWLFIVLSMAGVMLLSTGGGGENTLPGILCLMAAYTSGAFYALLSRKISAQFTSFEMTYVMFLVGFVFFTGWAAVQYRGALPRMLILAFQQPVFSCGVLYLSVMSSVCSYLLINYALSVLPVARACSFQSVSTLVSVLAGVIIMKDTFMWVQALAMMMILLGVWGVNRFARKDSALPECPA